MKAPQLMIVAVAAILAAGCAVNSTTVAGHGIAAAPSPTSVSASKPAASPKAVGGLGSPGRDGVFEFVVLDVSQVHQVGDPKDPGLSVAAQGVFVVATISIRNVGSVPTTFFDRDQTLTDSAGTAFSASMAADIYGNLGIHSTKIAPGNELVVHIAFDVPVDTVPKSLTLRASSSSAGVTVPLS